VKKAFLFLLFISVYLFCNEQKLQPLTYDLIAAGVEEPTRYRLAVLSGNYCEFNKNYRA